MIFAKKRYYHSYNIIVEHDYHIEFDKPQKIISSAIIICTTIVVLICNAIGSQTAADPYIRQVNDAFLNKSGQLIESLVYNKYGVENEEIISLCDAEISRYEGFVVNSEPLGDFKEENTLLISNALNLIEILNDIKADALDGIIDGKDVDVYIRSFVDNLHVVVDINQSQLGTIFSDNLEDSVEGYFDSDDE